MISKDKINVKFLTTLSKQMQQNSLLKNTSCQNAFLTKKTVQLVKRTNKKEAKSINKQKVIFSSSSRLLGKSIITSTWLDQMVNQFNQNLLCFFYLPKYDFIWHGSFHLSLLVFPLCFFSFLFAIKPATINCLTGVVSLTRAHSTR